MSQTETIEPRRPALGRAPVMSPSLRKVAHLDNPKKNPLARKAKVEYRSANTIRVSGGNRVARRAPAYPEGSFVFKVSVAGTAEQIRDVLKAAHDLASVKAYGRVLEAARARCRVLDIVCPV